MFASFCIASASTKGRGVPVMLTPDIVELVGAGDDACIACSTHVALADGVGSAQDSAEYSAQLIKGVDLVLQDVHDVRAKHVSLACDFASRSMRGGAKKHGASTLCFARMGAGATAGTLLFGNLGDSGAMVLRRASPHAPYKVVFRTTTGQHDWNQPHQVSNREWDDVDALTLTRFTVREDDIVLLASDGLFDNLDEHAIAHDVDRASATHRCETIAHVLCMRALLASKSQDSTPYSRELARHLDRKEVPQGKPDDVTVFVGKVG